MGCPSVALLHYSSPPVVGGVEEVVRQQASLLTQHGHPVRVLTGEGSGFDERCPVFVEPWFGSRHPEVEKAQTPGREDPDAIDALAERVHRHLADRLGGVDVLVAHNVLSMPYNLPLTRAVRRVAAAGRVGVVGWNHDSPFFYEGGADRFSHPVWSVLRAAGPGVRTVTLTDARRAQFRALYGDGVPVEVVPNGIDPIRFFRLDPTTVRVIEEQRLFEADCLLVQPCRLHPRKNIELSIRVLRAVRDQGLRARLLLTGAYDPHEASTVEYARRLGDLARRLGVGRHILLMAEYRFADGTRLGADRVTIRDLYLVADLLFMPSRQEGFGIPLLEAGMIKLPIVCSDIPPFREIGASHVTYFDLDEPPESIARKVVDAFRDGGTETMFRHVIRHYAWDNLYRRCLVPLLDACAGGRTGYGAGPHREGDP